MIAAEELLRPPTRIWIVAVCGRCMCRASAPTCVSPTDPARRLPIGYEGPDRSQLDGSLILRPYPPVRHGAWRWQATAVHGRTVVTFDSPDYADAARWAQGRYDAIAELIGDRPLGAT